MSLTNIIQCFQDSDDLIDTMVKSPQSDYLVCGSQSNKLFIYNLKTLNLAAKIENVFQDTISYILFVSDYVFYVVDMTGLLIRYEITEEYGLMECDRLELQCVASSISATKTHLFVTSEDNQFIVINRKENYVENQQNVQDSNHAYPIDKNKIIVAGQTSYIYQVDQYQFINSQKIPVDQKVCESYFYNSTEQKILFIGTNEGIVVAYQLDRNLQKLQQISQINLDSTSPITLISSVVIYQKVYYLISNNESLYIYEDNLQLRCCVQLNLRGITSIMLYNYKNQKYKQVNEEQLMLASTTSGDILLIDILNGILVDEMDCIDQDDSNDKTYAITQMCEINYDSFAVTGDKNVYIYSKMFTEPEVQSDKENSEV